MTENGNNAVLYDRICEITHSAGMEFPADMTKINVALQAAGLDYAKLGFERCKDMFAALGFELSRPYPSGCLKAC